METEPISERPIGVFDSGMGGLTVLRALRQVLPGERFVYLGDTARLPYGTKSARTVSRYALQAASYLGDLGVKALVVACNTASATALPELRRAFGSVPVIGVVEPGAVAAAGSGGAVGLLATEGTVSGGAYQRALLRRGVATVRARPAPLLVTLAEEGADAALETAVLAHYLRGLAERVDTLLLGCTHFPVFVQPLTELVGDRLRVVDSATTTAATVAAQIERSTGRQPPSVRFFVTDSRARFARVGARFLGEAIEDVTLVDI